MTEIIKETMKKKNEGELVVAIGSDIRLCENQKGAALCFHGSLRTSSIVRSVVVLMPSSV